MTFLDLINADLKEAFKAMEAQNWKTAGNLIDCAIDNVPHLEEHEKAGAMLKINRMIDTMRDLKAAGNDWMAQYYACSAGATSINDAKAGRCKTVRV